MNKAKKLLSFALSSVFLNVSVIEANGVKVFNKIDNPDEGETKISYGKDLPTIKEQVEEHNKICAKGYEIQYWGGFGPEKIFQRFQYLLNPVAYQSASECSFNLFNAYATNRRGKEASKLWSVDKVRRQMNSGQDSDIEDNYIDEEGRICRAIDSLGIDGHTKRYISFVEPKKRSDITNNMNIHERNVLALMYKYIQTNRHSYPDMNKVYYSSAIRENFIKYFDETEDDSYISEKLCTPFGNLKVKKGSTSKVGKKILRQVHIYAENDTKETYYSYNRIGNIFNELDTNRQIKILEIMKEYLSTKKSYNKCQERWKKRVDNLGLGDEDKEAFAVLFGIAVLAEPLRECDDGTSQRCVYKTMLYYLKKLKDKEIKLNDNNDWEKLAKDLESGEHNKQKNLFKFYKRVRVRAAEREAKMMDETVANFFDMEAGESKGRTQKNGRKKRVRGEKTKPKGAKKEKELEKVRRKEMEKTRKTKEAKRKKHYVLNHFIWN